MHTAHIHKGDVAMKIEATLNTFLDRVLQGQEVADKKEKESEQERQNFVNNIKTG
jgi:hypothetical protein